MVAARDRARPLARAMAAAVVEPLALIPALIQEQPVQLRPGHEPGLEVELRQR